MADKRRHTPGETLSDLAETGQSSEAAMQTGSYRYVTTIDADNLEHARELAKRILEEAEKKRKVGPFRGLLEGAKRVLRPEPGIGSAIRQFQQIVEHELRGDTVQAELDRIDGLNEPYEGIDRIHHMAHNIISGDYELREPSGQ